MSIRPVGVAFAAAAVLTAGLLSATPSTPSTPSASTVTAVQSDLVFDAVAVQRAHDQVMAASARQQAAQRRAALAAAQQVRQEREARQRRAQARASRSRRSTVPVHSVETGSGLPTELKRIRSCESGPNGYATHGWAFDYDYTEANPNSTASGAYQFLDSTWRAASGLAGRAKDYAREVQDRVALSYYRTNGGTPWNASRSCWGR